MSYTTEDLARCFQVYFGGDVRCEIVARVDKMQYELFTVISTPLNWREMFHTLKNPSLVQDFIHRTLDDIPVVPRSQYEQVKNKRIIVQRTTTVKAPRWTSTIKS